MEKTIGSKIEWEENKNITKKKLKKGNKIKFIDVASFFNFFKSYEIRAASAGKLSMNQEDDLEEKLDEHMELGNEFKNSLIPLALEYYLGVIDKDETTHKDRKKSVSADDSLGDDY